MLNPSLGRNFLLAKQLRHPLLNTLMFKQTSRASAGFGVCVLTMARLSPGEKLAAGEVSGREHQAQRVCILACRRFGGT